VPDHQGWTAWGDGAASVPVGGARGANPSSPARNRSLSHGSFRGLVTGLGPRRFAKPATRQSPSTHSRSTLTVIHSAWGTASSRPASVVMTHTATRASL
jgi:hypothetical protein